MNPEGIPPITLLSLGHCVLALLWGALVIVSVGGWGALGARLAGVKKISATMAMTVGVPTMLALGGLLNLFHAITRPWVLGVIGIGFAVAVGSVLKRCKSGEFASTNPTALPTVAKVLMILAIVMMAWRFVSSVHSISYQISDDFSYYLVAPEKMLELHQFSPDPFSERRLVSTVGGAPWLETLWLVSRPLEEIQMSDWGLGSVLLGLLALALAKEFELNPTQRYVLVCLFLVTPQLRFNLTFVVLPSALFLGLVWLASTRDWIEEKLQAQALIVGSVAGAITCLKSTYITPAVLFLGIIVLLRLYRGGSRAAAWFAGPAAVGFLVVMLPWAVANHATVGTWFFPLLGKGTHYTAYGHYLAPSAVGAKLLLHKVVAFCIPMMVLLGAELLWGEKDEQSLMAMALLGAATGAALINGAVTGGDSMRRYNYPSILPGITLLYAVFARRRNVAKGRRIWVWAEYAAGTVALLVGLHSGLTPFTDEFHHYAGDLQASLSDYRITTAFSRDEYARMEQDLPTDGVILATLDKPFLLDFGKHRVLLADWPGAASPKPGWPAWEDGDALARFLATQGVRYVVFSYNDCSQDAAPKDCQKIREDEFRSMSSDPNVTVWVKSEMQIAHDARTQYLELARTRHHVYDDGRIVVLDLTEK